MTTLAEVVTGEVIQTLSENEEIIRTGLRSFVDVGRALARIRDERQYTQAGFDTFEDYCRERWEISSTHAYDTIGAARVAELVSGMPDTPRSQRAAQPLVKVLNEHGEEAVSDIWQQIVERHDGDGPVTGREVSRFLKHGSTANYSGKPGWFELLGEVGDTLIRADKQLSKVEAELRRKPNQAFRDKAGKYAAWAEELATRLRGIENA